MSQENVESVRRAYELFNRAHRPLCEVLHPEIEWHTAADMPDSGTYRGHHGVETVMSAWASSFGDARADIQEIVDAGEHVVAWCILRGEVGQTSGAVVELPEAHVWTFREGKVVEVREYRTRAEALEAAGLSE